MLRALVSSYHAAVFVAEMHTVHTARFSFSSGPAQQSPMMQVMWCTWQRHREQKPAVSSHVMTRPQAVQRMPRQLWQTCCHLQMVYSMLANRRLS